MKKLFFKNEINKIDLFKNDVIMAENTFLQSRKIDMMKINLFIDQQISS
jgi:hypothetical protein